MEKIAPNAFSFSGKDDIVFYRKCVILGSEIVEKEKSCGALVYSIQNQTKCLLLIKHKQGGHWSFPKGHVEAGESEHQTALREVKEETGLSIELLDGFRQQVTYSPRPGVSKDVVYFLGYAQDTRTQRQESEISDLRWVDLDESAAYLTYDNDKMLLAKAKTFMQNNPTIPQE